MTPVVVGSRIVPQTTHEVTFADGVVVKRYTGWDRGEPDREWTALTLLREHAPGLAPEPLERRIADGAPEVVMTRLPGRPLGEAPLTGEQVTAVAAALRELYAVPLGGSRLPLRRFGPAEAVAHLRAWIAQPHAPVGAEVERALGVARDWLAGEEAERCGGPLVEQVFTLADGNLANLVWDGVRCRVVDFEDSGLSDPAYEVADLLEHVTGWLPGLIDADQLVAALGLTAEQQLRLAGFRRVLATFWLLMLLPGNPAHHRNPPGSLEQQAARVTALMPSRPPHP